MHATAICKAHCACFFKVFFQMCSNHNNVAYYSAVTLPIPLPVATVPLPVPTLPPPPPPDPEFLQGHIMRYHLPGIQYWYLVVEHPECWEDDIKWIWQWRGNPDSLYVQYGETSYWFHPSTNRWVHNDLWTYHWHLERSARRPPCWRKHWHPL